MTNLLALLAISVSVGAEVGPTNSWRLSPRYSLGQELTFHGKIIESSLGSDGVRFEQPFQLEATMFVLEIDASRVAQIGCYTVVRLPDYRAARERKTLEDATRVHFDMVKVKSSGEATWANDAQIVFPPEGSPPWELGYFAEVPRKAVAAGEKWVLRRAGQPLIHCEVVGSETLGGLPCVKVAYRQQSQNWDQTDINLQAWRNETTVWIDRKTGFVQRLNRDFQMREPGERTVSRSILAQYDQTSNLQYHGQAYMDRDADFRTAYTVQNELEQGLLNLDKTPKAKFAALQSKLELSLKTPSASPYRAALGHMRNLAEQAVTNRQSLDVEPGTVVAGSATQVGRRARPFVVRNLENGESISLKKTKGKAVVLAFIDPKSELSLRSLRDVLAAVKANEEASALVLAVCNDTAPALLKELREKVPGQYTVCTGSGLDKTYGVEAMPHTLFIDANGYLRQSLVGTGPEMLGSLTQSLAEFGKRSEIENVGGIKPAKETFLR